MNKVILNLNYRSDCGEGQTVVVRGSEGDLADVRGYRSIRPRYRDLSAGAALAAGGSRAGRLHATSRHDQPTLHPGALGGTGTSTNYLL